MEKQILTAILDDRKDRKLKEIAEITIEVDANIIMLALDDKGPMSYAQLKKYVENPSTAYRHVTGLEKIGIIEMKKNKFCLSQLGRQYLSRRNLLNKKLISTKQK